MSAFNGNINMSEAAQRYRERQWAVVPLCPHTGEPLPDPPGNGSKPDPWKERPDANIGLACGRSGLIAIVFHLDKLGDAGKYRLNTLSERYQAPTIDSPNGARAMLIQADAWDNREGDPRLPPGVHVLAGDDIVPLPPSTNGSHGRYRWAADRDPDSGTLAPAPVADFTMPPPSETLLIQLLKESANRGSFNDGNQDGDEPELKLPPDPLDIDPQQDLDLGAIDEYAELMTELTCSPPEFNRLTGLVLFATAIQERAHLPMAWGNIHPNLYAALVASSSVYHKSTCMRQVTETLNRAELTKLHLPAQMSPEGLMVQLSSQPYGLIVRDEINTMFTKRNSGYLADLKPLLTELYDGATIRRALVKEKFTVKNPCLSILGATTPYRFYGSVTDTDWYDGFLARFLFVVPDGEPDLERETPMRTPAHEKELKRIAEAVKKLGKEKKKAFVFDADVFDCWHEWYKSCTMQAYEFESEVHSAFVSRNTTHALKFALILAAVDGSWGKVDLPTMEKAIALADSYKGYVHRLIADREKGRVTGSKLQKVLRTMSERDRDGGGAAKRTLLQYANMKAAELDPCLAKLLEYGACEEIKDGRRTRYRALVQGPLPIRQY